MSITIDSESRFSVPALLALPPLPKQIGRERPRGTPPKVKWVNLWQQIWRLLQLSVRKMLCTYFSLHTSAWFKKKPKTLAVMIGMSLGGGVYRSQLPIIWTPRVLRWRVWGLVDQTSQGNLTRQNISQICFCLTESSSSSSFYSVVCNCILQQPLPAAFFTTNRILIVCRILRLAKKRLEAGAFQDGCVTFQT